MAIHGVASTKGHLASNGGLRGHSVDELYPLSVIARIEDGVTKWVPMHLGTGRVHTHGTAECRVAHRWAAKMKEEGWK